MVMWEFTCGSILSFSDERLAFADCANVDLVVDGGTKKQVFRSKSL